MEFHAIILCGEGRNLSPFSAVRSSGTCKALLPVANKPLVSYTISWCEQAEFNKITVAVSSRYYEEVKAYVDNNHNSGNIEVVGVEDAKYSGEVIRQLALKITSDFVILPCDIITDIDPKYLINVHRNNQESLISGIYYKNNLDAIDKKSLIADYIIHTPDNKHYSSDPVLLDVYSKDEIVGKKTLEVRMSMLWRFPYSVVSGKILRASIFFCSYKALSILEKATGNSDNHDGTKINAANKNIDKVVRDIARRSWRHRHPLETVAMHIIPATNEITSEPTTFIRANNISAYLEANRYIMRLQAKKLGHQQHQPSVKGQATIGIDSIVGQSTEISERTSVKRTVIGNNCKIGKKCRINGCVVFDGVIIEDDVVLENCVIGKKSIIRSRAKLTSCNVEGEYTVRSGLQTKNELLQNLTMESLREGDSEDDLEETPSSEEDEDDDGESGSGSNWEVSEGEDVGSDDDGLFDRS